MPSGRAISSARARRPAPLWSAPAGPAGRAPDGVGEDLAQRGDPQARLRRDVDPLAPAGAVPGVQGEQGAGGRVGAGVQERLGHRDPHRRPVAVAVRVERAPCGPHHQVGRGYPAFGPVRPNALIDT